MEQIKRRLIKLLNSQIRSDQSGQTIVITVIVLTVILISVFVVASGSLDYFHNAQFSVQNMQATNLAEAGIDKAVASLNATAGSYTGESNTSLGAGTFTTKVTPIDSQSMQITSTGYIPNKTKPVAQKTIQIEITKGAGISFVYGMLVGNGGISMGNGSSIQGSIYANGNITGGNNETITGDAYVAGGTQPNPDQESDCVDPNKSDFIFGKTVSGNSQLDVAQSFIPSTTATINKVSLYLKKFGSPSNITVRILADNSGKPNKNSVLATGTLLANQVTFNYGFVDVSFTTNPSLTTGTTYWIVLDTSNDSSNYWGWCSDTLQGYTRGSPMWSPNWQANNPTWNAIAGDLGFKTYMGGVNTQISMSNGSVVKGSVHAHTISGVTVDKDAYYQLISNSTVLGTSNPNSTDPAAVDMPISASNIADWQSQAAVYGTYTGNITGCPSTLGPGKYVGNFTTNSNCTITVKTPIWITGTVSINNSTILKMDSSLGASSGVIIVDGQTTFANGDDLRGTGQSGSYLTLLSTYNSESNGLNAISSGNSSITGILYAPYGIIQLANNATFKEIVGWQINMGQNTILTYDSGLISTFFSSGPGGSFSVVKGTYQAK